MLRICQAAQANRTSQSLSKSVSFPTLGRKESTGIQHCIKAIAGEVVKSRSVHLINFCGGGQVIELKSATAHSLDRYTTALTNIALNEKSSKNYISINN